MVAALLGLGPRPPWVGHSHNPAESPLPPLRNHSTNGNMRCPRCKLAAHAHGNAPIKSLTTSVRPEGNYRAEGDYRGRLQRKLAECAKTECTRDASQKMQRLWAAGHEGALQNGSGSRQQGSSVCCTSPHSSTGRCELVLRGGWARPASCQGNLWAGSAN